MITLSRIYIHPVKSMRGLQLSHTQVITSGLLFDRIFMLTKPDGTFITARQYPEMVLFTPTLLNNELSIKAPDGRNVSVNLCDFLPDAQPTEVWGNNFTALVAPSKINSWLSDYFQKQIELRWLGPELTRRAKYQPEIPLSFVDGYPFMLINQASFQDLQRRCPANLKWEQFRPNLVVSGAAAFAEDNWQVIQIGEVVFDLVTPCSRCILTTVSVEHGEKHPTKEPLPTLQTFRTAENGDVDFGQNMIARNNGIIRTDDKVEILSTKPSRPYSSTKLTDNLPTSSTQIKTVIINYNGICFTGNNQQVLLEQLEQQNIRIRYSCRAGICGSCRITLLKGEVAPLKQNALGENNSILACSCIPKGNINLTGNEKK